MDKVAFLNLSLHSFNQERVWEKFFDGGDKNSFNLYIHSKSKNKCRFSDYYIDKSISTGWGHFSLVEATIELIKAALEDEENEYFSLISDSHFPLYTLGETVSLIKERYPKTTFAKHFISSSMSNAHNNHYAWNSFMAGYGNTTSAIDAVQFKMHSGNIDAGTIKMYGVS